MNQFLQSLRSQRWDDHRYYHHSRINQSLHFISALSFLCAYVLLFVDPIMASLVGWLVAMTTRQAGHFFFEPQGYDHINQASQEHKEAIKVGYNLNRKLVLIGIWAAAPLALAIDAGLWGLLPQDLAAGGFLRSLGAIWLVIGAGGLLFRAVQLTVLQNASTALVWVSKILTDPFHDLILYHKAPLALLRGELIDPRHAHQHA